MNIKELRKKAKSGDPQAQYELGRMYLNGNEEIKKNSGTALSYLKKAAEQKHVDALRLLASFYGDKKRTKYDPRLALGYLVMLKDQGEEVNQNTIKRLQAATNPHSSQEKKVRSTKRKKLSIKNSIRLLRSRLITVRKNRAARGKNNTKVRDFLDTFFDKYYSIIFFGIPFSLIMWFFISITDNIWWGIGLGLWFGVLGGFFVWLGVGVWALISEDNQHQKWLHSPEGQKYMAKHKKERLKMFVKTLESYVGVPFNGGYSVEFFEDAMGESFGSVNLICKVKKSIIDEICNKNHLIRIPPDVNINDYLKDDVWYDFDDDEEIEDKKTKSKKEIEKSYKNKLRQLFEEMGWKYMKGFQFPYSGNIVESDGHDDYVESDEFFDSYGYDYNSNTQYPYYLYPVGIGGDRYSYSSEYVFVRIETREVGFCYNCQRD